MSTANADGDADLVRHSGHTVIALYIAYGAATIAGFSSLANADEPMSDPWFAIMEWLIIVLGPVVLVFLSALGRIGGVGQPWSTAALVLAGITFALSAALHAVLLAIGRDHALVAAGGLLSFTWPSAAYAIDILAWDGFFAVALLCCAMALRHAPGMQHAFRAFALAGLVAVVGLAGPISGSMALRNIGIIGYAVIFPLAVWLVLRALPRRAHA